MSYSLAAPLCPASDGLHRGKSMPAIFGDSLSPSVSFWNVVISSRATEMHFWAHLPDSRHPRSPRQLSEDQLWLAATLKSGPANESQKEKNLPLPFHIYQHNYDVISCSALDAVCWFGADVLNKLSVICYFLSRFLPS